MEAKTSSYLKIADLKAADLLTDRRKRRFLEPFVPGPMSTSGAAAVLGVKLNAMHYRVGQLLELGLLEVAGSAERKGRAVKLYGPTADAFLVPFTATPHAAIVEMIRRLSALDDFLTHAVATLTVEAEHWGVLVSAGAPEEGTGLEVKLTPLDARGVPTLRPAEALLAPSTPAVQSGETFLRLEFEEAKDFQRELADLTARFGQRQSASGKPPYIVLGMTPVTDGKLEPKSDG